MFEWKDNKSNERPDDKEDIIMATWYDGWSYELGTYQKAKDKIKVFLDDKFECFDWTDLFDKWSRIPSPDPIENE